MYYFIPRNDLTVSNCSADDYVPGPLEDWIEGALAFDGKARVASISHAELTKNMEYPRPQRWPQDHLRRLKRQTVDMGANNFLIEVVFKTEAGHTNGVLASKLPIRDTSLPLDPTAVHAWPSRPAAPRPRPPRR